MNIIPKLLFACTVISLAAIPPAFAESLEVLAGKTHYHGIAFASSAAREKCVAASFQFSLTNAA